jgi:hypothetical protein
MFKLIIKRADNSIYWVEYFHSQNELTRWLTVEMTRPYWLPEFTTETIDMTPPPPSQDELDAIAAKQNQMTTFKHRVRSLARQNDLTAAEIKEALWKYLKAIDLAGSLY